QDLIGHYVPKSPPPHKAGSALEILLAGACELVFLNVPAHAAVDAANRLAQHDSKAVHFKPLINAVLRRVAADGRGIAAAQDAARLNTADWLWRRWCETYGEETVRAIAAIHVKPPPIDIHTKADGAEWASRLNASALSGNTLRLSDHARIDALPGYEAGEWWVQDYAASLPAQLLGDVRGSTVIDLCAAPGGKTMQLAAASANVIAVERDASRLERLAENLKRTRLHAELIVDDVR